MLFEESSRHSTFFHVGVLVRASIKVYLVLVRLCIKSANKRSRPRHTQPTKIGVSPPAARSETAVFTGFVNPCCVLHVHYLQQAVLIYPDLYFTLLNSLHVISSVICTKKYKIR